MIGRGDSESVAMTHEDFGPEAIGQTGEDSIVGVLYAGKTKKGFGEWADERSSMLVNCLCEQEWCVVRGVFELSCASSLLALARSTMDCVAKCGHRSQGVIGYVSCDFIYSAFTLLYTSPSIGHIPSFFVPCSYFSSSSLFLVLPLPLSPSSTTPTFSALCYVSQCTVAPNNPTKRNQDSFIMKNDVATSSLVIACFDGHGQFGHDVSKFCKIFMETTLVSHPLFLKDLHRAILDVTAKLGTRMRTDILVTWNIYPLTPLIACRFNSTVFYLRLN
jgi:hypothetical protein